jgi:hypothetical protein
MGILDQIRKKVILESPETVNSDWTSASFSLDDREGNFSVSVRYDDGISVDMNIYFQVSNDDVNFGDVPDYDGIVRPINITDASGTAIFDIPGTGTSFGRIRIEVISGSIDVEEIYLVAAQRH